jgi:hypothetical protein
MNDNLRCEHCGFLIDKSDAHVTDDDGRIYHSDCYWQMTSPERDEDY